MTEVIKFCIWVEYIKC